jgi:hypothetical protein
MSKNVIEILRGAILEKDGDDVEVNIYGLRDVISNWPTVGDPNDEDNQESVDLENWEILKINKESAVFCAGGDWQEPITFTVVPNPKEYLAGDKLLVTMITPGFKAGMGEKEILKKLEE